METLRRRASSEASGIGVPAYMGSCVPLWDQKLIVKKVRSYNMYTLPHQTEQTEWMPVRCYFVPRNVSRRSAQHVPLSLSG